MVVDGNLRVGVNGVVDKANAVTGASGPDGLEAGAVAGQLIWMPPKMPSQAWAEKCEWYQEEPYCVARGKRLKSKGYLGNISLRIKLSLISP